MTLKIIRILDIRNLQVVPGMYKTLSKLRNVDLAIERGKITYQEMGFSPEYRSINTLVIFSKV